ncbi:hypothetical protein, partial [Corallococcus soli]|uniref:hypothetical protein n=1 Tax=Corallococcus soli TaxID=2710757 RepID=UPI0039EE5E58
LFSSAVWSGSALKKLTAGFRNPYLLGLAIWFSKTEPLVLRRDFCYRTARCCRFLFNRRAAASISVRIRRQLPLSASCGILRCSGAVQ